MKTARVGDLADQVRGVTYAKGDASDTPLDTHVTLLRAGNIGESGLLLDDLIFVPKAKVAPRQMLQPNDVLIAASSGSLSVVGKAARVVNPIQGSFGAFCKVLRPTRDVDPAYFAHFFRTSDYRRHISSVAAGANINNLRGEDLDRIEIPLPPLPEQRRIAAILDEADALRNAALRRAETLPELLTASYTELFGDPVRNPRGWPVHELGDVTAKVSDGPFGSNLKSAHYTDGGVRVIRLQNIGANEFLHSDAAFISEQHFDSLRRHELVEGDIVVGTLGDPILRACSIPPGLGRAINKADCVQVRPDGEKASGSFLVATLNHPSVVRSAELLAHGQTRSRVSMSQVRALRLAIPPQSQQTGFDEVQQHYSALAEAAESERIELSTLFASLQHRAFRGEL